MIEHVFKQIMENEELRPLLRFSSNDASQFPAISLEYEERRRPENDRNVERIVLGVTVLSRVRHYFEAEQVADQLIALVTSLTTIGYGDLVYLELRQRQSTRDSSLGLWRVGLQFEALVQTGPSEI